MMGVLSIPLDAMHSAMGMYSISERSKNISVWKVCSRTVDDLYHTYSNCFSTIIVNEIYKEKLNSDK